MNRLYIMDAMDCLKQLDNDVIDMIYIDPPYNTKSNKFEYFDSYENWNELMKKVLIKARLTLKDTGCVFISIDDNKVFELKLICDEIFGKNNFLGIFVTRQSTRSNNKFINTIHEYILSYSKNKNATKPFRVLRKDLSIYKDTMLNLIEDVKQTYNNEGMKKATQLLRKRIKSISEDISFNWIKNYNSIDEYGNIYSTKDLSVPTQPNELYIEEINLLLPKLKSRGWVSKNKIIELYNSNKLVFKGNRPYEKQLLIESTDNAMSILNFYSRQGRHDLEKLGLKDVFQTAKPVELIKYLIKISTNNNDIILDFFAGSGTTAQAVVEVNKEENSNRKFYICQLKEELQNNDKTKNLLKSKGYEPYISNLIKLRLDILKDKYDFKYEIIT